MSTNSINVLAEVFGYPITNNSQEAKRIRNAKLCPFGNIAPNCTKDKREDPLGVCSIFDGERAVITCPVRFRQDWLITRDAAQFLFPPTARWTSFTEVQIDDIEGNTAGKIDVVLASYDDHMRILDFGALEIQAVYVTGNIRNVFNEFQDSPKLFLSKEFQGRKLVPHPDYLSSSRKRLAPQLLYKGGIINAWGKKTCIALDSGLYDTLPKLKTVRRDRADFAWLVYGLKYLRSRQIFRLKLEQIVYTRFEEALNTITHATPGNVEEFIAKLQIKLAKRLGADESNSAHRLGD